MLELRTRQCKKVALSQHHDRFCRFKTKTAPCASETYGIGVSNRAERDVGIYSRHVFLIVGQHLRAKLIISYRHGETKIGFILADYLCILCE